jgi:predicted ester cyclase
MCRQEGLSVNQTRDYPEGDEAKAIVRRRFDELDRGNAGILDELFSPDYTLNFPGQEPLSLDQTRDFYRQMYSAFLDLRHEVVEQVSEGDKVVTRWRATGTHVGEFMGIAPTNQEVSFAGINIYTFDGDKLSESQVAWDLLGLLAADPEVGDTTNTEL